MSELTNIHARAAKDLTTPNKLPADPNALDQVKLVAGNFPPGYAGNEALTLGMVKEIAAHGREAELEEVLQKATQKVTQEETRAKAAEEKKADKTYVDASLTAVTGGRKAYPTLASALADSSTFTMRDIIEVVLDGDNNGAYWWNGADLYKSDFDPLTHAKAYTDQAEADAKAYADQNKLDIKKVEHSYQDGNLIGSKSARYLDFGVTSGLLLRAVNYYDSVVIPVNADDILFILNDKQIYTATNGGAYAFFAEDPYLNHTQERIVDNRTPSLTDPETSLSYVRVTVPVGAKYLILNTRYINAAGTVSHVFNWAIHNDAFNSSYEQGTEVITRIDDVKVPTAIEVEKLSTAKANAAKSEAITASATDATAKANAAQQAAAADTTTKANAAEVNAKAYADQNKVDKQSLKYSYQDGNIIGSKSDRATNFGLNGLRALAVSSAVDSVSVPVNEKTKLVVFNDKGTFSQTVQAFYAFFAEDPLVNRTQARIEHVSVAKTDEVSNTVYQEVVVPDGAKYILLNTRFTSGGVSTIYNWAVHENFFTPSYTQGHEYISRIDDVSTEKSPLLYDNEPLKSIKNLYVGNPIPQAAVSDNGASKTANYDDVLSPFIPVEFGKTYTISGLSPSKMGNGTVRIVGFINPTIPSPAVKVLGTVRYDNKITVTVDDPSILYIAFPIIRSGFGTAAEADNLAIQVELGDTVTAYEPVYHTKSILKLSSRIDEANANHTESILELSSRIDDANANHTESILELSSRIDDANANVNSNLNLVSQFTQMDVVRDPSLSALTPISKTVGPYGLNYKLAGLSSDGNASNNLYGQISFATSGKKSINVNIMKRVDGVRAVGALKRTAFTVPSGALDNPDSFPYVNQYPKDLYVHPSMAYSSTGVAGFKYWMISSVFPPTSAGGVLWEDEDLFVSNDAINWQRVRSMYETDKSYTTAALRLPPQTLATNNARKHCFLPSLAMGDSIEVSVPASNGMPAMDRVTITLDQQNPWKHDPLIMIDGGYVYTYHTFHLPTQERTGGKNRFIVCVRTNNGIDWDVVRSDGSTMRITEETSRQIFTKDEQGRYNFIYYGYDLSGSNPEIIKFGEGDYEFFYGSNFAVKFTGSTPYTFDFSNRIPIQTKAAGNHPTIFNDNGVLYLITNNGVYRSENRGLNWTNLPNYPMWLGGVSGGMSYKKATCKAEGGKFLLLDVQQWYAPTYTLTTYNGCNSINSLLIYEYASFSDFLDKANNGLVDAYIDLYVTKANPIKGSREVIQLPYIAPTQVSGTGTEVTQRLKIGDITVESGDVVYLHVTLNSRKGAEIIFGGIDIS